MTLKIFISYRRGDSAAWAGRLYERLAREFGKQQLFMDVDHIIPGHDFTKTIDQQVADCDILLCVIGQKWVDARIEDGVRRLDEPSDFVRIEVETALSRGIRVIPILVDGASMPKADDLPPNLRALSKRHGMQLSHAGFAAETRSLVDSLKNQSVLGALVESLPSRRAVLWMLAPVVLAILLAGYLTDRFDIVGRSPKLAGTEKVTTKSEGQPVCSPSLSVAGAKSDQLASALPGIAATTTADGRTIFHKGARLNVSLRRPRCLESNILIKSIKVHATALDLETSNSQFDATEAPPQGFSKPNEFKAALRDGKLQVISWELPSDPGVKHIGKNTSDLLDTTPPIELTITKEEGVISFTGLLSVVDSRTYEIHLEVDHESSEGIGSAPSEKFIVSGE